MEAKIIFFNGTEKSVEPRNGTDFGLQELQEIVGGYIECLSLGDKLMVINEEGKLKDLPMNFVATNIIRNMGYNDYIVGNALLCDNSMVK